MSNVHITNHQLSTSSLNLSPAPQADRTGDPGLLQNFPERFRPLTRGRLAAVTGGGVEEDDVDMTEQTFQFACQTVSLLRRIIDFAVSRISAHSKVTRRPVAAT